ATPGHPDTLQMAEGFIGHAFGQVDQRVVIEDLDATDVTALDTGFVGDGADDVAGFHFVRMAHFDTETFHARFRTAVEGRLARRTTFAEGGITITRRAALTGCSIAFTRGTTFSCCEVTRRTTLAVACITRVAACGTLVS